MKELINTFKILADETRLRIIMLLNNKELCVCEISNILEVSQPNISRNLAKLRDAGFVENKRQGQWVFYYLQKENDVFADIINSVKKNISSNDVLLNDQKRLKDINNELCERMTKSINK